MHEDNAITFYAVPAGTYEFRLSDGNTLSGHQCISENKSTEIITNITTNGDNTKFTINETKDITIKVVDAQNWNVSIEATGPTYHIKAPWDGTNWSWKEFTNQGDGTYSLLNTYTNSKKYNYIKISSDDDLHKEYNNNATLVNSPSSTSDKCIYTFNPSDGSLEIRKCNTVNIPYHIYFDNSIANWPSNKLQFVVGHASYSRGHDLTSIANTQLYHVHIQNYPWQDAGYYAIVSEPTTFGGDGWSRKRLIDEADKYSSAYLTPLNIEQDQAYLFEAEHANNGTPISITKKTQSSELNTTQTIKYAISEYGGTPAIMNSGTTPAKITMSSYKFVSRTYNAVSEEKPTDLSANGTTYSQTFTAAHTATTTLTVSEVVAGYKFTGWYTETGKPLSQSSTYTYYPTSNTTIYARFEYRSTVNYMESPGGKVTVTYTDQNGDTQTKELSPNQPFDIATGGVLNFTARANEGYTFQGIYVKRPNHVYTNNLSDTVIVNSNITIIPEFTHNSDSKIVFLDLSTKLPVTDSNTSDENRYWTKGGAYFKVHYDGSDHDIQDWDINNKLYYHNQHVAAGKVLIFKRYGNDDKLKNSSPTIVTADDLNKYAIIGKEPASWTEGEWREGPQVTITLDPCNIGTYGIKYNGVEYLNNANTSREIEMPYGSSIQIIDATPTSPHYKANPRYETSVVKYTTDNIIDSASEIKEDEIITVYGDNIKLAPNLVTTATHRVYLHIPKELKHRWGEVDNEDNFNTIYLMDYLSHWRVADPTNDKPDFPYGRLEKMSAHETFAADEDEYYYIDIPEGYHTFVFERKRKDALIQYGQPWIKSIILHYGIPTDETNNCFTIINETGDEGRQKGTWGPLPEYTITLGYTDIGRYGIVIDGQTIYENNSDNNNTHIREVPYGTEVQLLKGEPGDAAYTTNLVKEINGQKEYIIFGENENQRTFTITSDVKFDDIFATKDNQQTVFIAVPKNHDNLGKWYTCSDANHKYGHDVYVWQTKYPYDYKQEGNAKQTMKKKVAIIETDDYIYYQYTLDEHVYDLNFQFKSAIDNNGTWDSNDAHAGTITSWCPPISTKNCFYLNGEINGDNHTGGYKGYWDYGPPCKVEMGYTNIGRYGIKDYNNTIHYAIPGVTNTIFYVPYGTQVEVLEGEPGNQAYNGMVGMFDATNTTFVDKFHDGVVNRDNIITITKDTAFDDLFVSKEDHIVYLGVPNEGFDIWNFNSTTERMTVRHRWPRDYIATTYVDFEEKLVIDNITYYKYTLPKGIYSFQFSHRRKSDDKQLSASRHFGYQIPVTEYNCFILENRQDGNGDYDGYWAKLPATSDNVGDYRLLYAEKELIKTNQTGEGDLWETAFRTVYTHPSDIITTPDQTVSLHINTNQTGDRENIHPMVILQQFKEISTGTYQWVDIEAHTVLPLKATGNMAMLPGRKKAYGDLPFYSDGIDRIKNDTTYQSRLGGAYKGSGVWNFQITNGINGMSLNLDKVVRYEGPYYIRTEALPDDGWNNYTGNHMTYSEYADYKSGFSHYFCKWLLAGNNVRFTIANPYAQSISDPLCGDATDLWGNPIPKQMVERDEALNEDANVRFAWHEMNNFVHRAYLGGSTHVHHRFLVVKGDDRKIFSHYVGNGLPAQGAELPAGVDNGSDPRYGLFEDEEIFRDDANWIYHADVQILPGCSATITAKHYGQEQYFIKNEPLVYGYDENQATNKYPIRLLYDFKINRLITGYIPNGDNSTTIEPFTTNLMLIRKHHDQATQLLFNNNKMTTTGAYGVMTFERDFLRDPNKSTKERAAYFISFPFDVKISDVFGFGQFYKHWFIQYYDGESRAKNGLWADTDTYWKHITDPNTILKAHQGYALLFSLSNIEKSGVLDASKEICLYFPSTDNNIGNITDANPEVIVDVPAHVCTIERENRKTKDSNWNLIGVPAYADVSGFVNKQFKNPHNEEVYFYWKRDVAKDTYEVWDAKDSYLTFQTMHAYMLQYAGVINWQAHTMSQYPTQIIARKNTEENTSHTLRITLNQANNKLDQTYVRVQEEDATADFDMNKDQFKMKKPTANIYSLIQTDLGQIEAGANVLPMEATTVPLGVIIKTAGEYTFAMPDGTDGIVAELIDYQTNTRTNLALDSYTVTLPAGTNHTRFAISLQPDKTVTGIEDEHWTADGTQVRKFLIDGRLYMLKEGVLYDAQGREIVNN